MVEAIRVGCVEFINAKPLVWSIENERPANIKIIYETPAGLARLMEKGKLDVALLSSLWYLQNQKDFSFVKGIGISSFGRVKSVKLLYKGDIKKVKRVGLDKRSLTANALARIILKERYNITPEYVVYDPTNKNFTELDLDAGVVIGDLSDNDRYLDLGYEWKLLTNLPFVFALWVYKRKTPKKVEIIRLLQRAKKKAGQNINEITHFYSNRYSIPFRSLKVYLTKNIKYTIADAELKGLSLFQTKFDDIK